MQREPSCSMLTGMMMLIVALRNFAQRAYHHHHLVILKQNMTTKSETKERNLCIIYKVECRVCVSTL